MKFPLLTAVSGSPLCKSRSEIKEELDTLMCLEGEGEELK
jgi:hypothetical protein